MEAFPEPRTLTPTRILQITPTQLRANRLELFAFPLEGEAFALCGFYGLDAAGVVVLNKNTAPIGSLKQ